MGLVAGGVSPHQRSKRVAHIVADGFFTNLHLVSLPLDAFHRRLGGDKGWGGRPGVLERHDTPCLHAYTGGTRVNRFLTPSLLW